MSKLEQSSDAGRSRSRTMRRQQGGIWAPVYFGGAFSRLGDALGAGVQGGLGRAERRELRLRRREPPAGPAAAAESGLP